MRRPKRVGVYPVFCNHDEHWVDLRQIVELIKCQEHTSCWMCVVLHHPDEPQHYEFKGHPEEAQEFFEGWLEAKRK